MPLDVASRAVDGICPNIQFAAEAPDWDDTSTNGTERPSGSRKRTRAPGDARSRTGTGSPRRAHHAPRGEKLDGSMAAESRRSGAGDGSNRTV